MPPDIRDVYIGNILCCPGSFGWYVPLHLGEPVYYYQDRVLAIRFR